MVRREPQKKSRSKPLRTPRTEEANRARKESIAFLRRNGMAEYHPLRREERVFARPFGCGYAAIGHGARFQHGKGLTDNDLWFRSSVPLVRTLAWLTPSSQTGWPAPR